MAVLKSCEESGAWTLVRFWELGLLVQSFSTAFPIHRKCFIHSQKVVPEISCLIILHTWPRGWDAGGTSEGRVPGRVNGLWVHGLWPTYNVISPFQPNEGFIFRNTSQ